MTQPETAHTDQLISKKIATASVVTLVQVDQATYYLVELLCGDIPPEKIDDYLKRRINAGELQVHQFKPLRHYADNPEGIPIFGFVVEKHELAKLGLDSGRSVHGRGSLISD